MQEYLLEMPEEPIYLENYVDLIKNMPVQEHSFMVNIKSWNIENDLVQEILSQFSEDFSIMRVELKEELPIEEFEIKTLMWGYPTKGRGNNISRILEKENFGRLVELLQKLKEEKSTNNFTLQFETRFIDGCSISTMSKFLYFLGIEVDGYPALILDRRIVSILSANRFKELRGLSSINNYNSSYEYDEYLKEMSEVADQLYVSPEKLEMFLFVLGRNLC
jgi:hypothetical protein